MEKASSDGENVYIEQVLVFSDDSPPSLSLSRSLSLSLVFSDDSDSNACNQIVLDTLDPFDYETFTDSQFPESEQSDSEVDSWQLTVDPYDSWLPEKVCDVSSPLPHLFDTAVFLQFDRYQPNDDCNKRAPYYAPTPSRSDGTLLSGGDVFRWENPDLWYLALLKLIKSAPNTLNGPPTNSK